MWSFLLTYGSHDVRLTGFRRLMVVNGTPGKWGVTNEATLKDAKLGKPWMLNLEREWNEGSSKDRKSGHAHICNLTKLEKCRSTSFGRDIKLSMFNRQTFKRRSASKLYLLYHIISNRRQM